jgi:CRISPR-associated protein Cas1
MRQIIVQGANRSVVLRGAAIEVHAEGAALARFDPRQVDSLLLEGAVSLSVEARRLLLRAGVELAFCDARGRFLGRLCPAVNRGATLRVAQAGVAADPVRRLHLARQIVVGKLTNQRVSVARIARGSPSEAADDALVRLRAAVRRAAEAPDLDSLRGVEGAAARAVFGVFGLGLKHPAFTFTRRSRRPPRDPVNAVLSYAYTLLTVEIDHAARAAGLDPGVGLLHETGRGRPACALDLCEEWRPLVDGFVLALFNRRQLQPADFVDPTATLRGVAAPPDPGPDEEEEEALPADLADLAPGDPPAIGEQGEEGAGDDPDGDPPLPPPQDGAEDGQGDPRIPAVYLSRFGRRVVLSAWRARLGERLRDPVLDASFELGELMRLQARRFAAAVKAPPHTYTAFALR